MKKFFALMLTVAMLLVAGSAMAASPTITASPTSVSVVKGQTATATLTATAGHTGGTMGDFSVSGPSWVSVSGNTVTFSPSTSVEVNMYTVTVNATETFTEADTAGHTSQKTEVASTTITVTVANAPNTDGGSQGATSTTVRVESVKTDTVSNVKVVNVTIANIVTVAQIRTPSVRQAIIVRERTAIISAVRAVLAAIPALANLVTANTQIMEATNVEVITSPNFDASGTQEAARKNLEKAAARLQKKAAAGSRLRAIGVMPPFKAAASGLQPFDLPKFDETWYGKKPVLDLGKRQSMLTGSFFAAADNGSNEAVFLDSTGASTDVIPDGTTSADAGVVTAIVYVEEGAEYEPLIATEVTAAEETAMEASGAMSTSSSVEVAEVSVGSISANTTATFNPVVDDDTVSAVGTLYGKTLKRLPYTAASTTGWSATTEEKSYLTANSLVRVCSLPTLQNIDDGAYIAEIYFDNTPTGDTIGAPVFYPNGVSATGAAASKLYVVSGSSYTEVTASNAKTYIANGNQAYLVFEVVNGAVTTADFESAVVTLSKPSIVVTSEGHEPTPTDPVISALITDGYINSSRVLQPKAFGGTKPTFTEGLLNYVLNFTIDLGTVEVASWNADVDGTSINISAADETTASSKSGTITVGKSQLKEDGSSIVTLTVTPQGASSDVYATWTGMAGVVPVGGVGSSSGGCSAGSTVLAMAVLGAFIASRKK